MAAWFSQEIPFQEGPYKFRGLPGLIFEIYDTKDNFIIKLIGSKKINNTPDTSRVVESNFGKKPVFITREKYIELMINDYNNPFSDLTSSGENWELGINGKIIKTREGLLEVKKFYQDEKRRHNNPIDLNMAIKY